MMRSGLVLQLIRNYRHIRGVQQVHPSASRSIEGMICCDNDEYADAQMIHDDDDGLTYNYIGQLYSHYCRELSCYAQY